MNYAEIVNKISKLLRKSPGEYTFRIAPANRGCWTHPVDYNPSGPQVMATATGRRSGAKLYILVRPPGHVPAIFGGRQIFPVRSGCSDIWSIHQGGGVFQSYAYGNA